MRDLYRDGLSTPVIAAQFGVSQSAAYDAIAGRTWDHLPGAAVTRSSTEHLHRV